MRRKNTPDIMLLDGWREYRHSKDMNRDIHRRVWLIAGPIIISNISVPMLGAVDTAVMGHLPDPKYIDSRGLTPDPRRLCITDNVNSKYLNLEIEKNFSSWYTPFFADFVTDDNECNCTQEPLPKVVLEMDI